MGPPKLKVFCQNCHGSRDRSTQRPIFYSAKRNKKTGAITSAKLLTHLSESRICFDYYSLYGDGVDDFSSSLYNITLDKEDVSRRFCLTNTNHGPASGLPETLDRQVMYNPSVELVDRCLIDYEMNAVDSDLDDDAPIFDSVNSAEQVTADSNTIIVTPSVNRYVSAPTKVKIKLMKIMRDHNIPLVAERELYKWAIESESLPGFSWSAGNCLIRTRRKVFEECYKIAPELRNDRFEPHLIDWSSSGVVGHKQIYVRSFRRALFSLLTNASLIKEENLSFPNQTNPTSLVRDPELTPDTIISELHHGQWWLRTWKEKCVPNSNEILVPIILYMDGIAIDRHGSTTLCPLNMTLGILSDYTRSIRPDAWETIYFHPQEKSNQSADNVNNLHHGLRAAFASFKEVCESSHAIEWRNCPWNGKLFNVKMKFAIAFFIGDTEQHDKLCGHYTSANTRMMCRHCSCPRALGINAKVNVLNASVMEELEALEARTGKDCDTDMSEKETEECPRHKRLKESPKGDWTMYLPSLRLWRPSDFKESYDPEGVSLGQHCRNISHHNVLRGNAFHELDFGANPHSIHLASPGERLHMHQLGCAKRAAETFRDAFLGTSKKLLDGMDSIASFYGSSLQRQSDRDFPRTNFSESIHTAKKEGNHFSGMLLLQILCLLSDEGRGLLTNRHTEDMIDGRIYALELILGMEEFLKWSGTTRNMFGIVSPDSQGLGNDDSGLPGLEDVFEYPKGTSGASNLDKMVVHFLNIINKYLTRTDGMGNNLIKNHMYFHLSQFIRLYGPPSGWDSSWSESNHKTEVKAPAKRTSHTSRTLIQQTAKRHIEYRTIDRLHLEFDYYDSVSNSRYPKQNGGSTFTIGKSDDTRLPFMKWNSVDNQKRNLPCLPTDVINFCANHVLDAVKTKKLTGFTEHKRIDSATNETLLFRAHPSFKSDSGQECNVWYDWAYFLVHLPNKSGVYQVDNDGNPVMNRYPCQILCFLDIDQPTGTHSVRGFDVHDAGFYAVVRCFLEEQDIRSRRKYANRKHHSFVKKGTLRSGLYLFPCSSIYSEAAVVRNAGSKDEFFVVHSRDQWLTNFNDIMSAMESVSLTDIIAENCVESA